MLFHAAGQVDAMLAFAIATRLYMAPDFEYQTIAIFRYATPSYESPRQLHYLLLRPPRLDAS